MRTTTMACLVSATTILSLSAQGAQQPAGRGRGGQ
jgi:hypothetical protein